MRFITSSIIAALLTLSSISPAHAWYFPKPKPTPKPIPTITQPYLVCQEMFVTGYSPASSSYGPTASGRMPRPNHTVAAYWSQIPEFTWIHVYGLGYFQVEDTGGQIGWNRLDIFVETNDEAFALTKYYKVCWPTKTPVG